jgi:orotate phosphoribosyltransferase
LIDDTWTTGACAQSAAIALREAGAAQVVIVVGRHFDRNYGPGGAYYRQATIRQFMWDRCCLEDAVDEWS